MNSELFSRQEALFKERITIYLENPIFVGYLLEAIASGYLSVAYIRSLRFFDWTKVTRPPLNHQDGYNQPLHELNVELTEFKHDMAELVESGVPPKLIWQWILEMIDTNPYLTPPID